MGWLDEAEAKLGRFNATVREVRAFGADPRTLTIQDTDDWVEKARDQVPPKSRAQIIAAISRENAVRYARLRRDMKWLSKQAVKHGLSPEDAKWLV